MVVKQAEALHAALVALLDSMTKARDCAIDERNRLIADKATLTTTLAAINDEMRTIADVADGWGGGVSSQAVRDFAERLAEAFGQ